MANSTPTLIRALIDQRYTDDYLGLRPIALPNQPTGQGMEILKAYLGWEPTRPYFGRILAVLRYGPRFFTIRFHVWEPHQTASLANRLVEINELTAKTISGFDYLETDPTDFGLRAAWLHTPDSELDTESLALRAVAKRLKQYSVSHGLCRQFRKTYRDVD